MVESHTHKNELAKLMDEKLWRRNGGEGKIRFKVVVFFSHGVVKAGNWNSGFNVMLKTTTWFLLSNAALLQR